MNRSTLEGVAVAISSPAGRSPRGLVRATGPRLYRSIAPLVEGDARAALGEDRRGAYQTTFALAQGRIRCIAIVLPGPRSFTGEDILEIVLPGNPHLLASAETHIIDSVRAAGHAAHRAAPGEFTARAFLNDRISLVEAEQVAATIAAGSRDELDAAKRLQLNPIVDQSRALADRLTNTLGLVEAGIDFSDEEDVVAISNASLHAELSSIRACLEEILAQKMGGEAAVDVPRVVLVGPPNAGKSTLFNRLLGRRRVVVSSLPGTTRDTPAERVRLGGREVLLVDTAGIDPADGEDPIASASQAATRRAIERAGLVIYCRPIDCVRADSEASQDPSWLILRTKADLGWAAIDPTELAVSAHDGTGIGEVAAAVAARLAEAVDADQAAALLLLPRHRAELSAACEELISSLATLGDDPSEAGPSTPEVLAEQLRAALDHLAALEGGADPESVLDVVFSSFCIGK